MLSCDADISELVAVMARENIGSVMLTDPIGRLAGIVSERNLVPALARNGAAMPNITAQQPMTNGVVACRPEVGIAIALGHMSTNQIRHLPVVNDDRLLGLISIREILIAGIERRRQETDDLRQAHESLEELISEGTEGLRQGVTTAEHANKSKTTFLANASHELRPPLDAVIGLS